MKRWIAVAIGTICLSGLGWTMLNSAQSSAPALPTGRDQMDIYETALEAWLKGEQGRLLVNTELGAAPSTSDSEVRECAKGLRMRSDALRAPDLKSLVGAQFRRKGTELVDGEKWSPLDPALAIAQGKSVEASVAEGLSHSLISFSQVAFSQDGKDALVEVSIVCGSLCGSGDTLHLRKTADHWAIVKRCISWIS